MHAAALFINDISKFVGHDSQSMPVTTMTDRGAVTFRHASHATWTLGQVVTVSKPSRLPESL